MRFMRRSEKVDLYELRKLKDNSSNLWCLTLELSMESQETFVEYIDDYGREINRFILYTGEQADLANFCGNFYLEVRRFGRIPYVIKRLLREYHEGIHIPFEGADRPPLSIKGQPKPALEKIVE